MTRPSRRVANNVMPEHLSQRTRYLLLATMIAGLLYALLFYSPPLGGLWTQVFFDSLHVPVFGLIAVGIFVLWRPGDPWAGRALVALGAACTLGLLSEIAQIATSRDASVKDFVVDCLGAAGSLGLAIALTPRRGLSLARRALAAILGLILLGWALAPLAHVSAAYLERNARFPVIFDADNTFGRKLMRLQNARYRVVPAAGNRQVHAEVTFLDAPWPGVAFHDLAPDWASYESLVVDLAVDGRAPLRINLRVHDQAHRQNQRFGDRFNRNYDLPPGRHELEIKLGDIRRAPQSREMDMTAIAELIIFGSESDAGRSFRLYGIRLE